MEKTKTFKKVLAVTLAGAMFLQGGTTYGHAYPNDTKTKALIGTLAGLGGIAIVALTCGAIAQADIIDTQNRELSKLETQNRLNQHELQKARETVNELKLLKSNLESKLSQIKSDSEISTTSLEKVKSELQELQKALKKSQYSIEYWQKAYRTILSSRTEGATHEFQLMDELITSNSELKLSLECANTTIEHLNEKIQKMESDKHYLGLLTEIAKDSVRMCLFSSEPEIKESLQNLKPYHRNTDFTQDDVVIILSSTMSYEEEIRNHNYDNWLKACGFYSSNTVAAFKICSKQLKIISKYLKAWMYNNRVADSLEKTRFLDRFNQILSY